MTAYSLPASLKAAHFHQTGPRPQRTCWFISILRISSLKGTLRLIVKIERKKKKAPRGRKRNNSRTTRVQREPVATCQIECQLISPSWFLEALTISCKSFPWYSIVAPMRYAGGQWRTDEEGSRWKGLVGMAITGCGKAAPLQGPIPVRIYWSFFFYSRISFNFTWKHRRK